MYLTSVNIMGQVYSGLACWIRMDIALDLVNGVRFLYPAITFGIEVIRVDGRWM